MGNFRIWLESQSQQVSSMKEAQALSRATGLNTAGIEFDLIEEALGRRLPVVYEPLYPLSALGTTPPGDKAKLLRMMGAFAQKMGEEPPDTLEEAQNLKIRGPEFRRMTPPIIVQDQQIVDGVSRVTAAGLLKVWELRAFVIGGR